MQIRAALPMAALLVLAGCGYVGPVVPPSPEIPGTVTDLAVTEIGDELQIAFTAPARTTDNLAIRKFSSIDLKAGPSDLPFSFETWMEQAKSYPLEVPPASSPDEARAVPMQYKLPVSEWQGKTIAVAVRTAIKKNDHYSPWSNVVTIAVKPALEAPRISVEPTAKGYRITWSPVQPDVHHNILRQAPSETAPSVIATVEGAEYVDEAVQWGSKYVYQVTASEGAATSLPSAPVPVASADSFPPSVPTGLTALPSGGAVELSWQRSPETDVAGYYVYRSVQGGQPERVGGLVVVPTYGDRAIQAGTQYQYRVSAVDRTGNESAKSDPVEVVP